MTLLVAASAGAQALPGPQLGTPPLPGEPRVGAPAAVPPPALPGAIWLDRVNHLRALAGLAALTENATWSDGDVKHATYCVKNDYIGHIEDTSNPYYTPEGLAAAQNGNVMVSSDVNASDTYAIDMWMEGPFHGVGIIDPALAQTGFGSYRESIGSFHMAAVLDVLRGRGTIPPTVTFPVAWPGNGSTVDLTSYGGGEGPDPLLGCPGYTAPTGLPIILQVGDGSVTPNVTAHSFSHGPTALDHCVFDETTYPDPTGRAVLNARDAIVLIPRAPLLAGATYTASITSSGVTTTWSFTIAGGSPAGDINGDGGVNVSDVFYLINYLFAGGPAPINSGDVNGDATVNVSDVFYLINYLFAGGPAPL